MEALATRDFQPHALIDTDSPADKAIKLLNKFLEGVEVRVYTACNASMNMCVLLCSFTHVRTLLLVGPPSL